MFEMIALGFPTSLFMLLFGVLFGLGISAVLFGFFGFVIGLILLWTGVFRVSPIIKLMNNIVYACFPEMCSRFSENLRRSFKLSVAEAPVPVKGIYCFHPHGPFSLSQAFHTTTKMTDWNVRPIKGVAIYWLWHIPILNEIIEEFVSAIPSHYTAMKNQLEVGSLSVALGGVREINYIDPRKFTLCIKNRKGIFRLAIETGTPIYPVITYGQNEMYGIIKMPFTSFSIPVPTWNSCKNWLGLFYGPLKNPLRTFVGPAVDPGAQREATDSEIETLREKYFEALRELYAATRPADYAEELEII